MSKIPEIWTPNGYVSSMEEYQKSISKKPNSELLYPAYVTSIIQEHYTPQFGKNGYIFGSSEKPSSEECGEIYRKIQCSQSAGHHPSFRHIHCNDPLCPVCYAKYSGQMSDRVTERVQGYKTVYPRRELYHLIFWSKPPKSGSWVTEERPYAALKEAFNEAARLLKTMGVTSAVVWYHPYRIRADLKQHLRRYRTLNGLNGKVGFWKLAHDDVLGIGPIERYVEFGPHWHAIADGYLMNTKKYSEIEGAGYKKKRYLDTESKVHEVAYYISTHCCWEALKSSVRYFGDISYRMLSRELAGTKIKDIVCQDCGAPLHEYACNEDGVCGDKLKDSITEKIKYYLYWKKGSPKPSFVNMRYKMALCDEERRVISKYQCLVTRFCRSE